MTSPSTVAAVFILSMSVSVGPVAAESVRPTDEIVVAQARTSTSLERAWETGQIDKVDSYQRRLIDRARQEEDELEECMKNPDNQHIEYIELLGACFCLATNAVTEGCQSSD